VRLPAGGTVAQARNCVSPNQMTKNSYDKPPDGGVLRELLQWNWEKYDENGWPIPGGMLHVSGNDYWDDVYESLGKQDQKDVTATAHSLFEQSLANAGVRDVTLELREENPDSEDYTPYLVMRRTGNTSAPRIEPSP
jgi:hypothetical protein